MARSDRSPNEIFLPFGVKKLASTIEISEPCVSIRSRYTPLSSGFQSTWCEMLQSVPTHVPRDFNFLLTVPARSRQRRAWLCSLLRAVPCRHLAHRQSFEVCRQFHLSEPVVQACTMLIKPDEQWGGISICWSHSSYLNYQAKWLQRNSWRVKARQENKSGFSKHPSIPFLCCVFASIVSRENLLSSRHCKANIERNSEVNDTDRRAVLKQSSRT